MPRPRLLSASALVALSLAFPASAGAEPPPPAPSPAPAPPSPAPQPAAAPLLREADQLVLSTERVGQSLAALLRRARSIDRHPASPQLNRLLSRAHALERLARAQRAHLGEMLSSGSTQAAQAALVSLRRLRDQASVIEADALAAVVPPQTPGAPAGSPSLRVSVEALPADAP